jgi:hypothetical protein
MIDKIVRTVLYEGYMLYPYRRSAVKNRQPWNFGILQPTGGGEASVMTTECLVTGGDASVIDIRVRFLQMGSPADEEVDEEVTERRIDILDLPLQRLLHSVQITPVEFAPITGVVEISATAVHAGLMRLRVRISNRTPRPQDEPSRDAVLAQSLISTHTILNVRDGEFVSLFDPPEPFRQAAAECANIGTWPVLIGREPERDCMLSSPIILYDYPQVAAESPGDWFDGTEIDEMLSLRIQTLSDAEKEAIRNGDERTRRLLERAENLTREELMALHGVMRAESATFKKGDRVRLKPKPGGDAMDVMLAGRTAIIEAVEQDFEDRIHLAVVIEDDPGKDLGLMRQPGHRFFFSVDEVERVA